MDMIVYDSVLGKSDPPSTTVLDIKNDPDGLPDGSYAFIEYYCSVPYCDCRVMNIEVYQVISEENEKTQVHDESLALIQYGWDTEEFYKEMRERMDSDCNFHGASLHPDHKQSKFADVILDIFRLMLEQDEDFKLQLEEHYYDLKFKMKERAKNPIPVKLSVQPPSFLPSLRKKRSKLR